MRVVLENASLAAEFDQDSGVLLALRSRDGYDHLGSAEGANLFRLIAPSDRWDSRYAEARQQSCSLSRSEHGLHLDYHDVRGVDGATLPFTVRVDVRLPPESSELLLSASVTNEGGPPITEVWFPFIGAWTGFGGPGKDRITAAFTDAKEKDPHSTILSDDPLAHKLTLWRIRQRWALRYLRGTMVPWLDLSDGRRGLSLLNYMQEPEVGGFAVENIKGYSGGTALVLAWFSNPEIEAGATWQSATFGIAVHQGDWHDTARRYRTWLNSWWQPPTPPERLRRTLAVQNVIFRSFDGEPLRPLEAIPRIARAGLRYGVEDLCVWDYYPLGLYGRLNPADPDGYPDDEREVLREALAEARRLGVTVSALVNHRLLAPTSDFAHRGGLEAALRNWDGETSRELYPISSHAAETRATWRGPTSVVLCQRSPQFREWATASMERLIDVGFNSLFIDQAFALSPCYSRAHGHRSPGDTHAAAVEWCTAMRALLRERHPNGYVIGEYADPFNSQGLDLIWTWGWGEVGRPDVNAYALPGVLHSWVTDRSVDDAQQGFLHGFHLMLTTRGLEGTLDDVPDFAEYIARLAQLRRRTYACTSGATFEDDCGLTVDGAVGKRFSSAGADTAVIANRTNTRVRVAASILLDGTGPSGAFLHTFEKTADLGASRHGDEASVEFTLGPREVAVWEVRRDESPRSGAGGTRKAGARSGRRRP